MPLLAIERAGHNYELAIDACGAAMKPKLYKKHRDSVLGCECNAHNEGMNIFFNVFY
jgi:hypothetical protein